MITLLQNESYLIGNPQAVEELKTKNHARILVISDSHGQKFTLINIVKQFGPKCDALVLCGDTAFDLAELLEQANEHEEIKNAVPPVLAFVRGNGDPSTIPVSFDIGANNPKAANYYKGTVLIPNNLVLTVNGRNFYVTHGHTESVGWTFDTLGLSTQFNQCKTALYGHTHIAGEYIENDFKFINPGSCARPRGGQPACFAIVTVEKSFCDTSFIKIISPFSSTPEYSTFLPVF